MPFTIAEAAHLGFTTTALAKLSSVFFMNICRLNPLSASFPRAVDSILGRKFLELSIPVLFEFDIE